MKEVQPSLLKLLWRAVRRLFADEAIPLAGNIAFRTMFSLFPFLIFLTALAGFFGNEELAVKAVEFIIGVVPSQIAGPLAAEIRDILTQQRAGLLSLAALVTVWSAMGGVDSIRTGLNRAYDLNEDRALWTLYLLETLFVIGAAFVLIAFSFLILFVPVFLAAASRFIPQAADSFGGLARLRYPLAIILLFASLLVSHSVLPARRLAIPKILPGVTITVVVWIAMAAGFAEWLVRFNSFASTYASLGGVFAAMFFVYLAALALIFGGEFNRVLALSSGPVKPDTKT